MEKVRFAFRSAFGNEVEAALAEVEEWEAAREAGAVYYDRWKAEYDRAEAARRPNGTASSQPSLTSTRDRDDRKP